MALEPGYLARVKFKGASTAMVAEACTALANDAQGRHRYQITNAAHRRLDPTVVPTVKENAGAITTPVADLYSIDLFGVITFAVGYVPTPNVTIDGAWLAVGDLPGAFDVKISRKNQMSDNTQYAQGDPQKRRVPTLQDLSLSLKGRGYLTDVYDSPGVDTLESISANGTPVLVEVDPDGQGVFVLRAWGIIDTNGQDIPLGELAAYNTSVQAAPQGTASYLKFGWSWGAP
jgi:hypothetical protein